MNKQLQIHLLSDSTFQLDDLILSKQFDDGSPYVITTAELTVYDVDEIIASGTLTSGLSYEDSENNSLVYSWSTAEVASLTENPQSNYRAIWRLNLTANKADRQVTRFLDIVYWKLLNPISEDDLLKEKGVLENSRQTDNHRVTEAIDNISFKCKELSQNSGYWDGSIIEFTDSDNRHTQVKIDSWDQSTKTITLAESVSSIPGTGDRFNLKRSYRDEIESSWEEILNTVNSWRPNLTDNQGLNKTVDSYDLKQLHLYKSVARASAAAKRTEDDAFAIMEQDYNEKASYEFTALKVKVDEDNSGDFDNDVDAIRRGVIWGNL